MGKIRQLWSVLLITSLLIATSGSGTWAQDTSDPSAGQTPRLLLPFVGSGDSDVEIEAGGVLTASQSAISPSTSESTDKEAVSAAASAGPLKLVSLIVTFDSAANAAKIQSVPDGQIIHRYKHVFDGFSVVTNEDNVGSLQALEGVTGVYLDQLEQPDTDTSPSFVGAPTVWNALGGQGSAGEGVIVGVLDTGIWPEHPSFSDPDPSGKPYAPAPAAPSGDPRACQFGSAVAGDAPFTCNNKLIGAYRFMSTYDAVIGLLPNEFASARDDNGHGTHTSSTAAGNAGIHASIFGVDRGIVSGIAPRAYVIMYKVCGDQGCYQSDSAAAIEQAIDDGVNVLNFSISGGNDPFSDIVEVAFLNAYDHGIFVAASAGNSGPGADTVAHRGPWVTTVGASTTNRQFLATLSLSAGNGDTLDLRGASVTGGIATPTPVVLSPDPLCGPLAPGTFNGEIVVCNRGVIGRVEKGYNVLQAGAGGMILRNLVYQDVETDNHFLPALHLNAPEGDALVAFLATHTGVLATITSNGAALAQGDVMAGFSSRGGPGQSLGLSKPDVTAPGVQILAGASPLHVGVPEGPNGELFQAIAGTSMSSPHVAGAGALLKALHPDWTPGQIKSALMTTAKTTGVVKEDGETQADAFDYGSGRIDLNLAGQPGITFDETGANYVALQNALWNANYPSLYHPALPGAITVRRTAKDVSGRKSEWRLTTTTDKPDWQIVVPPTIKVPANGQATFDITIQAGFVPLGERRFGVITLASARQPTLHIPVTFVRGQAQVTIAKQCEPLNVAVKGTSTCSITMQNTAFADTSVSMVDKLPEQMELVRSSLSGGQLATGSTVTFNGVLEAAAPPEVSVSLVDVAGTPAGGYLPLSLFDVEPIGGTGDETIHNFSVPPFIYGGEVYNRVGIVSDGYIVVGGGTGADVQFVNTNLPDSSLPNNVLAPFWTDLNPAFGGAMRVAVLTDGVNSWIVVDWDGVVNFSDGQPNQFEVWIGIDGVEDVSFVYGVTSNGEAGAYTVGAENRFGNSGGVIFFNGAGTPPSAFGATQAVDVTSAAGVPGAAHVVSFTLKAVKKGEWRNCANLTADSFQGTAISCVRGTVTP